MRAIDQAILRGLATVLIAVAGSDAHRAYGAEVVTVLDVAPGGALGNSIATQGAMTPDGRYVAFDSRSSNLLPGLTTWLSRVYLLDRATGQLTHVGVDSAGVPANDETWNPRLSADGRYVFFESKATNLVANDVNGVQDIFRHDVTTGVTIRVSLSTNGTPSNGYCMLGGVSADGRFVAFHTDANNLTFQDNNFVQDVYVRDIVTPKTTRVSVPTGATPGGAQGNGESTYATISADGRYVAFTSAASNLDPNDLNGTSDVFLHDRATATTTLISVAATGFAGNGLAAAVGLSPNGRFAIFGSYASDLIASDTNGAADVFVRDLLVGTTKRVSVSSSGTPIAVGSLSSIRLGLVTDDGRFAAFTTSVAGLVPDDTNGEEDVFMHDGTTGSTTRVSLNALNEQTSAPELYPESSQVQAMTADARYVLFISRATNLGAGSAIPNHHLYLRDRGPWIDLNGAHAADSNVSQLLACGTLAANDLGAISLTGTQPNSATMLFVANSTVGVPFFGGVLLAFPTVLGIPLVTDATGRVAFAYALPVGVPSQVPIVLQCAHVDSDLASGVALSNAVMGMTP